MVILIIAFIAVFAYYLDEEQMENPAPMYTPETMEDFQKDNKSHHLLEYKEDSDAIYIPESVKETTPPAEIVAYEAISSNIVAFYKNSLLQVYPDAEVLVVHEGMASDLARNIKTKAVELTSELSEEYKNQHNKNPFAFNDTTEDIERIKSMFQKAGSVASSEDMERIVGMIRDGSQITILTPSDDSVASFENDPQNSPVTPREQVVVQQSKPAIILLTKKVEEGESLPTLPN